MTTETAQVVDGAAAPRRLGDVLQSGAAWLGVRGVASSRLAFEWLVARTLDCKRLDLYLRYEEPVAEAHLAALREGMRRLATGEPLAYVLGDAEFMGRRFSVDRRVLIPRPETEELVVRVLGAGALWQRPAPAVIDVGTGSGCIAITLAASRPDAIFAAVDASEAALAVARGNAERLGVAARVQFERRDLLQGSPAAAWDAVVSNPPYIATGDLPGLPKSVRNFEPAGALDGGTDGLAVVRRLAEQGRTAIRPDGFLFLEIGTGQGAAARACLEGLGYVSIEVEPDLAGRDRVVVARLPAAGAAP